MAGLTSLLYHDRRPVLTTLDIIPYTLSHITVRCSNSYDYPPTCASQPSDSLPLGHPDSRLRAPRSCLS